LGQSQSQGGQSQSQQGYAQDNTILHPEQTNSLGNGSLNDGAGGNGLGGETSGLDSISGIQGQSPDTELQGAADTSYANVRTDLVDEATIAAEVVSPDTGVVTPIDRTTRDIQADAADAIMGGSSDVVQKPQGGDTPLKHENQPQDDAERRDDPLSQEGTYEGKLVFRPNELNQSGEDKEYFPPEDHHRFRVPQDAQHHVLRPDVTLKPGDGKPEIEVKDKQ
jgi:hypothetical protein